VEFVNVLYPLYMILVPYMNVCCIDMSCVVNIVKMDA